MNKYDGLIRNEAVKQRSPVKHDHVESAGLVVTRPFRYCEYIVSTVDSDGSDDPPFLTQWIE